MKSGEFSDKKILLLDKEPKIKNDRTWCFWENTAGFFEEIVYCKWDNISFLSDTFCSSFAIAPYQYKMIRGIDFYDYCFTEINKHRNVELIYGEYGGCSYEKDSLTIVIDSKPYKLHDTNTQVFNSIYIPDQKNTEIIRLLQHFKGWIIETDKPAFDASTATIMDFRVEQKQGTTFAYVLPLTTNSALIEYTLFTKELLPQEQYDQELQNYIQTILGIESFSIKEKEFGVIPMTNERLQFSGADGWNIGTAGGQTKASSGYTFQFIQKQSQLILKCLLEGKSLNTIKKSPGRFQFYDNTLLHILYHNQLPGKKIFTDLFKKNKPQQVLRFLDNETNLKEELQIISTLPTWPFMKAAIRH